MCSAAGHSPAGPSLPLRKLDLFLQQHLSLGDAGMFDHFNLSVLVNYRIYVYVFLQCPTNTLFEFFVFPDN